MNEERASGELNQAVNSKDELHLRTETLDSVMAQVCAWGVQELQGWDAAAGSLIARNKVATYGTLDESTNAIDQAQYDTMKGPCVDALKSAQVQYFDGDQIEARWRQYAESAAAEGIYSTLSFPLIVKGELIGALNFYSRERDALRPGQREEGSVFAAYAAVLLANAQEFFDRGAQVEQLKEGMETRTMIGQATGLLMAQEGLSSDEAFQKLVTVSQNTNIKLRDIAEKYVRTWEEKFQRQP